MLVDPVIALLTHQGYAKALDRIAKKTKTIKSTQKHHQVLYSAHEVAQSITKLWRKQL